MTRNMKIVICQLLILLSLNCFGTKEDYWRDKSDWSPLMKATFKSNYNKMVRLIKKGKHDFDKQKIKLDAVEIAIRNQDPVALYILLNTGKVSFSNSGNLIMIASGYKNLEIIKMLINFGFPVVDGVNQYSPLMAACLYSSVEIVEYLINNGSDINQYNKSNGMTPLMYAVLNGNIPIVKLLLERGANKDAVDNGGQKALDYITVAREGVINDSVKMELEKLLK
ncbi:MAG: ankyrin repeat domain-containing protein [Bacteroidetes bacterium]|nr:ankyrin repeat domain-containing protein [Bacteroidota bacterium]